MAVGVRAADVRRLLEPQGGLGQARCALIEILRRDRRASVVRRGLGDLFLALRRVFLPEREVTVNVGYLLSTLDAWAIDEERRMHGRPRCGGCVHYGHASGRCLHSASRYDSPIPADAEPARLEPPCDDFRSVRRARGDERLAVVADESPAAATRVARAIRRLEGEDAAAAALLVLHHLDRRSLRSLARELGGDRRDLARRLRLAESALGRILEDLP